MQQCNRSDELYHHGVKGTKWGVRRYRNPNGRQTAAGKKRIGKQYERVAKKVSKDVVNSNRKRWRESYNKAFDEMNSDSKNYQQAKTLVDKYDMTKWDDLARKNESTIDELRRLVEKH